MKKTALILMALVMGMSAYAEGKQDNYTDVISHEAFLKNVTFTVTGIKALENQQFEVNVGLKNLSDQPVGLMVFYDDSEVLILDDEGFAYPLTENVVYGAREEFVLIPKNAGIRAKWTFSHVESKPVKIRVFGQDYSL